MIVETKLKEVSIDDFQSISKSELLKCLFQSNITLTEALKIEDWLYPLSQWQEKPWSEDV